MGHMIRKQVYIEPHQEQVLKQRARELGVTEAELIRQCIDQLNLLPLKRLPDLEAWQEARAFMYKRMSIAAPQTGRGWTREELYDERLKRFSS